MGRYTKKEIKYIIDSFLNTISENIKKDMEIKIDSFGTFSSSYKNIHIEKDIHTGDSNYIEKNRIIKFIPSKKLKE